MTIKKLFAVMCVALLSACQGPAQYTGPALFIGDSITANWHVEWMLKDTINASSPTADIDGIHREGMAKIQAVRPGLVHIMAGTQEGLERDNFKVARQVLSLAFAARKAGAVVVIATIPPVANGGLTDTLFANSRLANLFHVAARVCGFRLADYNTALATNAGYAREELFSDGVHPNDEGYAVMRRVLFETLGVTPKQGWQL